MPDHRFIHVTSAGELVPVPTLSKALSLARRSGFAWLDFSSPTLEDLTHLVLPLGLNFLSIEDCLDENQIPKIDFYPKYAFILFNAFSHNRGKLSIREADLFIGSNFLVTVNCRGDGDTRMAQGAERVAELDPAGLRRGPARLLHIVLDQLVDRKSEALESLEEKLERAEESILSDPPKFRPESLLHLRRDLIAVRRSLFHEREILMKIVRGDCPYIPEKSLPLFKDVYDHLAKFLELTETLRDTVNNLMEMHMSVLNNRMAASANATNATVRRLTFITTIFMPLTLLTGIGGMSEWSMMTGPHNWKIAYPVFLLAMVVLGLISYSLLKRFEKKDPR
ncbi:MAG: magnesium transporter CorA family protein [bacterium]|nr:magnesium transporter CorA family protein [bacterium]